MSNIDHRYVTNLVPDSEVQAYLFLSKGQSTDKDIPKIIQYEYVRDLDYRSIYNLGFGDFEVETGKIHDGTMTDNGDVYKIFNTVLSSVPLFYKRYPRDIILVQGSDGRQDFEAECRPNCVKNCTIVCHKFNRRMKLYCNYLSRKIDIFESEYQFLGGIKNIANWFDFEVFIPGKLYDSIMIFQKNG